MDFMNIVNRMNRTSSGDHMVLLYDDKDVIFNAKVMASYIYTRITNNEKYFFITGDIDTELVLDYLRAYVDLDDYISSGKLSILNKSDAYSKEGKFEPKKMIALLKKLALEAIEEGFDSFGISGEISWVLDYEDGFQRIMDYEYMLNNEIFGTYPVSAVCRYNINAFSSKMIKNIIEVHPLIIWKGNLHENPFYFEVVNTENIDIEQYQVKGMLKSIVDFTHVKSRFHDQIKNKEKQYQALQLDILKNMVFTLTELLEIHDEYTKNHSENVASISMKIAKALGLSEERTTQIYYAGLVHDIGKAIIPIEIINKNGKLTEGEFDIIKKHSTYGYQALIKSKDLSEIANIVLQHHERIDGLGYPLGLRGDDIILESRILAIVDAYDAMTSDRSYRKALSHQEAVAELTRCSGTQFDAHISSLAVEKVLNHL